jgi:hypothetical protein
MIVQTATFQWSRALVNALLTTLSTDPAAALLVTPKIFLFTEGTQPGPESEVTDFTEADFSGYALQSVTLSGAVNIGDAEQARLATVTFVATTASPFVPNTILGYLLTDGVLAYYGGELFAEPVPIAQAGDFLKLDLVLSMPNITTPSL